MELIPWELVPFDFFKIFSSLPYPFCEYTKENNNLFKAKEDEDFYEWIKGSNQMEVEDKHLVYF